MFESIWKSISFEEYIEKSNTDDEKRKMLEQLSFRMCLKLDDEKEIFTGYEPLFDDGGNGEMDVYINDIYAYSAKLKTSG